MGTPIFLTSISGASGLEDANLYPFIFIIIEVLAGVLYTRGPKSRVAADELDRPAIAEFKSVVRIIPPEGNMTLDYIFFTQLRSGRLVGMKSSFGYWKFLVVFFFFFHW